MYIQSSYHVIICYKKSALNLSDSDNYLTFNEDLKFVVLYYFLLQVNLEGQQECEDELVVFIQASHCVSEHLVSQMFNDVSNSLLSFGGLLRPVKAFSLEHQL